MLAKDFALHIRTLRLQLPVELLDLLKRQRVVDGDRDLARYRFDHFHVAVPNVFVSVLATLSVPSTC
jgi:hypothetical protein